MHRPMAHAVTPPVLRTRLLTECERVCELGVDALAVSGPADLAPQGPTLDDGRAIDFANRLNDRAMPVMIGVP